MQRSPRSWFLATPAGAIRPAFLVTLVVMGFAGARPTDAQTNRPSPAPGETRDADGDRIARLVRELGSHSYDDRRGAESALRDVGATGRRQLEAALDTDDTEIRLRAEQLLRTLNVEQLWSTAPIDPPLRSGTVAELLELLAQRTGNRVSLGADDATLGRRVVRFESGQQTFWQVIDQISRQTGNHLRPNYDPHRPGLVLASGLPGKHPTSYSGPLCAQVTSSRRVFSERLDYREPKSETKHTFQINFQLMWEDRFRLVAYRRQPELVAAVTDTGERLHAERNGRDGWNVATPGVRQLTAAVRLCPPPVAARRLVRLELAWDLIAVGDMQSLDIIEPEPAGRYHQDDLAVTVESIEQQSPSRFAVSLVVARDMIVPDPAEALLYENRVEMFDVSGRPWARQNESGTLVDEGVRLKVVFRAPTEDVRPHRLRIEYPRIRDQRAMILVFDDVPLPTGRPE